MIETIVQELESLNGKDLSTLAVLYTILVSLFKQVDFFNEIYVSSLLFSTIGSKPDFFWTWSRDLRPEETRENLW